MLPLTRALVNMNFNVSPIPELISLDSLWRGPIIIIIIILQI